MSQRKIERNWIKRPSNVILLGIVENLRLTNYLIPPLIIFFASRDVVFHEQVNDGSHESAKEEQHVTLLVEEGNDESGDNNQQQQQQQQEGKEDDVAVKPSLENDDQARFEATPPLRRSGRKVQLLKIYRENAFIIGMMNVFEPSSYKEASQYSEWRDTMEEEYE